MPIKICFPVEKDEGNAQLRFCADICGCDVEANNMTR